MPLSLDTASASLSPPPQGRPTRRSLWWAVVALGAALLISLVLLRPSFQAEDTPGLYLGQRIGNLHLLAHYRSSRPVFYSAYNPNTGNWGCTLQFGGKGIAVVWHPKDAKYWGDIVR